MGFVYSKLFPDPSKPIEGFGPRIKNIFRNNWRGLLGSIVPLLALPWQGRKMDKAQTVNLVWQWMFWFFLIQPVAVQVTAMIPIFIFPLSGVCSSSDIVKNFFNESIALFILGGMFHLLLNNSGFDRRVLLWIMCSGDVSKFSGQRLVLKCSAAAFILSMFSNKLIVTGALTQYITPIMDNMQTATARYRSTETDFNELKYIINNAIQTSSSVGSIGIIHASFCTLAFRAHFYESPGPNLSYPDIFNYLQYSLFAIPVAFIIGILNCIYHILLVKLYAGKPMSASSMTEVKNSILKYKNDIPPKVTSHEQLTVICLVVALILFFTRWNKFLNMGWATFNSETGLPRVKDASLAAIFVIALHMLPRSCNFIKIITAKKQSELPPIKPESGILFWRFVDKNTNYGYFYLIGSGLALFSVAKDSKLCNWISEDLGKKIITDHDWIVALLVVCLISIFLANIMSGVAALSIWMPFVLCAITIKESATAASTVTATTFLEKSHLLTLAVGVGSSFGFVLPFLNTPAYFCHRTGRVPILKMLKYSFLSAVICLITLWAALQLWAPIVFNPSVKIQTAIEGNVSVAGAGPGAGKEPDKPPPPEEEGGD